MISVIIPHKNRVSFISNTIISISKQTLENLEVIIVDDYSDEENVKLLKKLANQDPRVRMIFKTNEKPGAANSRNIGIDEAKGDFILFIDSDDLLAPFCLEQRLRHFKDNQQNLDVVFAPTLIFNHRLFDTMKRMRRIDVLNPLASILRNETGFNTMSGLWKKEFLLKIGKWDNNLNSFQDWEFHVRAFYYNPKYICLKEPDNFYRIDSDKQSIASQFFKDNIVDGRFRAFEKVTTLLQRNCIKELNMSVRNLIIQNLILLFEEGLSALANLQIHNRKLGLRKTDYIILSLIDNNTSIWRYSRKIQLLVRIIWGKNINYDPWLQPETYVDLENDDYENYLTKIDSLLN